MTIGIGLAWTPFKRVGLWIREGISLSYDYMERPYYHSADMKITERGVPTLWERGPRLSTTHPEVVAFFTF